MTKARPPAIHGKHMYVAMKRKSTLLVALSGALLCAAAPPAWSQSTWYVDGASGSDAYPGISPALAFATIGHAVSIAAPGDTINVLPATYSENVYLDKPGIKLEALSGATVMPGFGAAFEVTATTASILPDTVIRGFTITGGLNGVWIHSDFGGSSLEVSPTVEMNTLIDNSIGILVEPYGFGAFCRPILRYNCITATPPAGCSEPFTFGISLRPAAEGTSAAQIRSNRIFFQEWALGIFSFDGTGIDFSDVECNVMAYNEWGIYTSMSPGSSLTVVNNTIAQGYPASAVTIVYGVQNGGSGGLFLENNIVWIPDDFACQSTGVTGLDLSGSITLGMANLIEDLTPGVDPAFADRSISGLDFHLLPFSPAIDAGNTPYVDPSGAHPVDFDHDGAPRLIDPFRTGGLVVDLGAHEYTTVALDLVDASDIVNSSGRPYVNWRAGRSIDITVFGSPGDLAFVWWLPGGSYGTNLVFPALGNMLTLMLNPPITVPIPATGAVSFQVWLDPALAVALQEVEFHFQAMLWQPGSFAPYLGAFTRRVVLEANQ